MSRSSRWEVDHLSSKCQLVQNSMGHQSSSHVDLNWSSNICYSTLKNHTCQHCKQLTHSKPRDITEIFFAAKFKHCSIGPGKLLWHLTQKNLLVTIPWHVSGVEYAVPGLGWLWRLPPQVSYGGFCIGHPQEGLEGFSTSSTLDQAPDLAQVCLNGHIFLCNWLNYPTVICYWSGLVTNSIISWWLLQSL